MTIAKGLDAKAMEAYIKKVEKIAAKEELTQELMALVAGADFMPMISDTVSVRYSCRRSVCRMIPMRESQWWIGQPEGGGKPLWFCAACGKQYIHGIKESRDLVHGQDLLFNYIVFLQFELQGGVRTLCAMAKAPDDLLQNQINTLKLVLANSKRPLNLGAQLGIMDLMTLSNDMFVKAMKDFPKHQQEDRPPVSRRHGLECRDQVRRYHVTKPRQNRR
jgi:hypothetical protein